MTENEKKQAPSGQIPELEKELNLFGKIASACVDRYKVVYLAILMVLVLGYSTYQSLPKETIPDLKMNTLFIMSSYPGASASDVEKLVTKPIEDVVSGVKGVKSTTSETYSGGMAITVNIKENYDMAMAKMEVTNAAKGVSLPATASEVQVIRMETGEMPVVTYTLGGNYDLTKLKKYGEVIQSEFSGVAGVKQVKTYGGYDEEVKIVLDTAKMREYNIGQNQISGLIQGAEINMPAGQKSLDGNTYNIRIEQRLKTVEDIKNLVLVSEPSRTVFLKDVAEVTLGNKSPTSYTLVYNQGKEGDIIKANDIINITVFRNTGADLVALSNNLGAKLEGLKGAGIPSDLQITKTYDESSQVRKDLSLVVNNAIGGLLTVIVVLFIFIGLNEALIVSVVIPLSMAMALIAMKYLGLTLNTISLTGFIIALGLLVDNAIVVMENIDRLRDMGVDRVKASKYGLNQVGGAIFSATMTTVAAFLPVALISGVMGDLIKAMPLTIISIILASLIVSITVTPVLCSRFLSQYKREGKGQTTKARLIVSGIFVFMISTLSFMNNWQLNIKSVILGLLFLGIFLVKIYFEKRSKEKEGPGIIDRYKDVLRGILEKKSKMIIILVLANVLFIFTIATYPLGILKLELFGDEEANQMTINVDLPKGMLVEDTRKIALQVQNTLYDYSDIKSFTSNIGTDNANKATITIDFVDKEKRQMKSAELERAIREKTKDIPGAQIKVNSKSSTSGMRSEYGVALTLKGKDGESLEKYANKYLDILKTLPGVKDERLSLNGGAKELKIELDNNRLALYQLNMASVASTIGNEISGMPIGKYTKEGDKIDINLYLSSGDIKSISDFSHLTFINNYGQVVHFDDIATIKIVDGAGSISHKDGEKLVTIGGGTEEGYNPTEVTKTFEEAVKKVALPSSITQAVGGEAEQTNTQLNNMKNSFMLAMFIVYLILVLQFNSLVQPLIILVSVPLALIGAVWGLILTGNGLGFYAMFGMVALVGIAVNDAIVLIDYANYLKKEGYDTKGAITESVRTRFQPVLATSLTTIGGVLPLALYNKTFSPLGYALIFGLVASTVLTLLIIPILYYASDRGFNKIYKKIKRGGHHE